MRVVAVLVVFCSCRVGAMVAGDAATPRGDGLFERVSTDSPLWNDVHRPGYSADGPLTERVGDANADAAETNDGSPSFPDAGACDLLVGRCQAREACYPFPFEGRASGETRCAFQGGGGPNVPCQSQLECDATTICSAPGQPDSLCLPRCDRANPLCPAGTICVSYPSYPGVGVCF